LLGNPGDRAHPDNFNDRHNDGITEMSAEGPISMRYNNPDDHCPERTVPACRRQGSVYNAAQPQCDTGEQYYAWPSRRIVEIARRFDQDPVCNGAPCHNGLVTSICSQDFTDAVSQIVQKIQSQLRGRCLPRTLQPRDPNANPLTVDCIVREYTPVEEA